MEDAQALDAGVSANLLALWERLVLAIDAVHDLQSALDATKADLTTAEDNLDTLTERVEALETPPPRPAPNDLIVPAKNVSNATITLKNVSSAEADAARTAVDQTVQALRNVGQEFSKRTPLSEGVDYVERPPAAGVEFTEPLRNACTDLLLGEDPQANLPGRSRFDGEAPPRSLDRARAVAQRARPPFAGGEVQPDEQPSATYDPGTHKLVRPEDRHQGLSDPMG